MIDFTFTDLTDKATKSRLIKAHKMAFLSMSRNIKANARHLDQLRLGQLTFGQMTRNQKRYFVKSILSTKTEFLCWHESIALMNLTNWSDLSKVISNYKINLILKVPGPTKKLYHQNPYWTLLKLNLIWRSIHRKI